MKIVIVDDHPNVLDLLRYVCAVKLGHDVVAEAKSGQQAVHAVVNAPPDLLLLDLILPDFSGFQVLSVLRGIGSCPQQVVIITGQFSDFTVFLAEQAHVQGFLEKSAVTIRQLGDVFQGIADGRQFWSPNFLKSRDLRHADPQAFDKVLSNRELEVLTMLGSLLSYEEIARRLGITCDTVKKHRFNIFDKLDLHSTFDLMRYAQKYGFLDSHLTYSRNHADCMSGSIVSSTRPI